MPFKRRFREMSSLPMRRGISEEALFERNLNAIGRHNNGVWAVDFFHGVRAPGPTCYPILDLPKAEIRAGVLDDLVFDLTRNYETAGLLAGKHDGEIADFAHYEPAKGLVMRQDGAAQELGAWERQLRSLRRRGYDAVMDIHTHPNQDFFDDDMLEYYIGKMEGRKPGDMTWDDMKEILLSDFDNLYAQACPSDTDIEYHKDLSIVAKEELGFRQYLGGQLAAFDIVPLGMKLQVLGVFNGRTLKPVEIRVSGTAEQPPFLVALGSKARKRMGDLVFYIYKRTGVYFGTGFLHELLRIEVDLEEEPD